MEISFELEIYVITYYIYLTANEWIVLEYKC